jgi:hypothetical protein
VNAIPEEIDRADIERKFRELESDVIGTVGAGIKSYAMAGGAVVLVTVIGIAYLMGRRRGKKRSTVVEIRRI